MFEIKRKIITLKRDCKKAFSSNNQLLTRLIGANEDEETRIDQQMIFNHMITH